MIEASRWNDCDLGDTKISGNVFVCHVVKKLVRLSHRIETIFFDIRIETGEVYMFDLFSRMCIIKREARRPNG